MTFLGFKLVSVMMTSYLHQNVSFCPHIWLSLVQPKLPYSDMRPEPNPLPDHLKYLVTNSEGKAYITRNFTLFSHLISIGSMNSMRYSNHQKLFESNYVC
jgi:hypothetical protein